MGKFVISSYEVEIEDSLDKELPWHVILIFNVKPYISRWFPDENDETTNELWEVPIEAVIELTMNNGIGIKYQI